MIKNMTVTATFGNNQVRVWGYDLSFYETEEAFLANVKDDYSEVDEDTNKRVSTLKNVLYTTVTILDSENHIETFTLGPEIKSVKYADIIESHINGSNAN